MKGKVFVLLGAAFIIVSCGRQAAPVKDMLERIDPGASSRIEIKIKKAPERYFELGTRNGKPLITADSPLDAAVGLNWYLKYHCGIHLSWGNMSASLPEKLPLPEVTERRSTDLEYIYDFNYCTFSYTMAFWDWDRWQEELDWMALHGVNLPLAAVADECVWRNLLLRLGYSEEEVASTIPGPAYLAWFEMNNIESWGGPLPEGWYPHQEKLQKRILKRMDEWGMKPVLPGYSGMVPHDAAEKLGLDAPSQGLWNNITSPSILSPTDPRFAEIAAMYYEEQAKLFGKAEFYSMDPFHESANEGGVDFAEAGKAVLAAMRAASPKATWVIQAWSDNPRDEMIAALPKGDILILDLFSECRPKWGQEESVWYSENGFRGHDWVFCMLENFGGRTGLHGRFDELLENYRLAREQGEGLRGIGFTMESLGDNPMMFELASELPWRPTIDPVEWVKDYTFARYGSRDDVLTNAVYILSRSVLNAARPNNQQGPVESIFCARPSWTAFRVYERSQTDLYFSTGDVARAAYLMLSVSEDFRGNYNFEHDLVDVVRQAVSGRARQLLYLHRDEEFLQALLLQDNMLSSRPEFSLSTWLESAVRLADEVSGDDDVRALFERNARMQITTWGDRACADGGKLHDYAYKEWGGLLSEFYYGRWKAFFDAEKKRPGSGEKIDWYALEEPWTFGRISLEEAPQAVDRGDGRMLMVVRRKQDCISAARQTFSEVFGELSRVN